MTQEDKELLLKDLCARLPYGLKAKTKSTSYYDGIDILIETIIARNEKVYYTVLDNNLSPIFNTSIDNVVLYLRPMSSMTEKENEELRYKFAACQTVEPGVGSSPWYNHPERQLNSVEFRFMYVPELIDWLNEHHFDYHGLIEKGLALEAPEGMY